MARFNKDWPSSSSNTTSHLDGEPEAARQDVVDLRLDLGDGLKVKLACGNGAPRI